MIKPTQEPGWEVLTGGQAALKWGDKQEGDEVHSLYTGRWIRIVALSSPWRPDATYRRRIAAPPFDHFI